MRRKAIGIAAYCLVQSLRGNLVQFGEVVVEHDPLAAHEKDSAFDQFDRDGQLLGTRRRSV